jgi:hypothetical protein
MYLPQEATMVRRLRILCLRFLATLWPGLAMAPSAALDEAYSRFTALYGQGRYKEAERFAVEALELSEREFGSPLSTTGVMLLDMGEG